MPPSSTSTSSKIQIRPTQSAIAKKPKSTTPQQAQPASSHAPSSYPHAPDAPVESPSTMRYRRFQDDFGRALISIKNNVNRDLGSEHASLRMETRNRWSMLVDLEAWWFEFEIISPRRFIVSEIFRKVNSGECCFCDSASVTDITEDLRRALLVLNARMRAIPAWPVDD